jgi:PAS domain S-box-containing protein
LLRDLGRLRRQLAESQRQLADREARYAEAIETLEAIRSGAVDAVVVGGPGEEQVYTLTGAERSYRLLVETVNAGAITLALDGMVLYANRQAAKLLGVSLERLLGDAVQPWLAPEERERFRSLFAQATAGEAEGEVQLLTAAGTRLPVHLALRRLDTPDLQAVCVVIVDLTERKLTEDALRQAQAELEARVAARTAALQSASASLEIANLALQETVAELQQEVEQREQAQAALRAAEEKFAKTFHATPVGVSLVRERDGRYVEVNDALLQLLGYRREEVLGRTSADLGTWRHRVDRDRMIVKLHRAGRVHEREVLLARKSGTTFPALVGLDRVEIAGEPMLVGTVVDITARKRDEEELRVALAAKEAALATNQTLLREVHHRVKNNLQMLCDMVYLQMEGMGDAEKAEVLRDTYSRIYAIARLHEQLYQAMQSGEIHLGSYLARLVSGFESLHRAVPVKMEVGDAEVRLDVDRAIHLALIVNELVTNAVKHAFVDRTPGEVAVRLHRSGETVEIQVRDNGKGLPPDLDLDQAKSLGLRIVKILAQRLRATITIENTAGATIAIRLPLKADE